MSWVYLSDDFPEHPKVVAAGGDAAWMFVCALAWTNRHGHDGVIHRQVIHRLTDRKNPRKIAEKLVAVGLWAPHPEGYEIHDYKQWNGKAIQRREQAQRAAKARWEHMPEQCPSNARAHAGAHAGAMLKGMPYPQSLVLTSSCPTSNDPRATQVDENVDPSGQEKLVTDALTLVATKRTDRRANVADRARYTDAVVAALRRRLDPLLGTSALRPLTDFADAAHLAGYLEPLLTAGFSSADAAVGVWSRNAAIAKRRAEQPCEHCAGEGWEPGEYPLVRCGKCRGGVQ